MKLKNVALCEDAFLFKKAQESRSPKIMIRVS